MADQFFGKGITVASGFDLGAKAPLDSRTVVNTFDDLQAHIDGNRAYVGMIVFVVEDGVNYQYDGSEFKPLVADIDLSEYAKLSDIPSLEGYATEEHVAEAIAQAKLEGEEIDLSIYAKISDVNSALDGKVDVAEGYRLISDEEAAKLAGLENFDPSDLEAAIEEKAAQADLEALQGEVDLKAVKSEVEAALDEKAVKSEVEAALAGKADKTDIPSLEGFAKEEYVDQKVADLVNAAPEAMDTLGELAEAINAHQDVYTAYVAEVSEELAKKVDKADGYGLMSDEQAAKLASLENYDDSELAGKVAALEAIDHDAFLTEHQDISHLAVKADVDAELAKKLEAIPEEYVTAEELEAEGFLKEHQDISHLAVKSEVEEDIEEAVSAAKEELQNAIDGKADEGHVHSYNELEDLPEIPSIEGLATVADEDAREIFSTDILTVNALGGIGAGVDLNGLTVREVLAKLLYPYVAPTVSVSRTPSGTVFEKGDTQTITQVKAVVGKKSEKITKIEVLNGSTVVAEMGEDDAIAAGGTFNISLNVIVEDSGGILTVKVYDAAGDAVAASATTSKLNFVYPYYFGVIDADAVINEDVVEGLEKKVEAEGTKSLTYTTDNQKMVIAYPKSYGVLTKVLDPNNFDVTNTFKATEVSITGLDGKAVAYYVYANDASTVSNFTMKFTM